MSKLQLQQLKDALTKLETHDRIAVLEWLFKTYPHQYDYATMCEPLRRFHDPIAKRPQAE